jgi:hypothetical protein
VVAVEVYRALMVAPAVVQRIYACFHTHCMTAYWWRGEAVRRP